MNLWTWIAFFAGVLISGFIACFMNLANKTELKQSYQRECDRLVDLAAKYSETVSKLKQEKDALEHNIVLKENIILAMKQKDFDKKEV